MRSLILMPLVAALLASSAAAQGPGQTGAFIVRLGDDTVAMERYVRTAGRIETMVVTRSPRTVVRRVVFVLAPDGSVARWGVAMEGQALDERDNAQPGTIPLLGGSWVPWELVLVRARAMGRDGGTVPVLAGGTVRPTPVRRTGPGTFALPNQFDQTMSARLDELNRMVSVDVGGGNLVERVAALDLERWAQEFARRDGAGTGLGPLSPRESATATVQGASLRVEYGRPSLRGRPVELLVPAGEVWRAGANEATALTTDRTLLFEGLVLEPGTYSLFVLPEANGWTLIVNNQTGMSGLDRDPARDVGRVVMRTRLDAAHAERFTIVVRADGEEGAVVFRWGSVEAVARFRVSG